MNSGKNVLPAAISLIPAIRRSFYKSILQCAIRTLDSAFSLAGVGGEDLDVQLRKSTPNWVTLGHPLASRLTRNTVCLSE